MWCSHGRRDLNSVTLVCLYWFHLSFSGSLWLIEHILKITVSMVHDLWICISTPELSATEAAILWRALNFSCLWLCIKLEVGWLCLSHWPHRQVGVRESNFTSNGVTEAGRRSSSSTPLPFQVLKRAKYPLSAGRTKSFLKKTRAQAVLNLGLSTPAGALSNHSATVPPIWENCLSSCRKNYIWM